MTKRILLLGLLVWCAAGAAQAAGWSVPAGASVTVGGGRLELVGGSMLIAGGLNVGAGQVRSVGDVSIASGGAISVGSGLIEVRENWSNLGNFSAGTGRVNFVDGLSLSNSILGTTQFFNLSLITARGETYLFQSGSEQRVAGALQIQGNGSAIRLASSTAGSTASLNLLPAGTQAISNVGVNGVAATGQLLARGAVNQTTGGAATGWFAAGSAFVPPEVIPASGEPALLLLALLLALVAMTQLRRPLYPTRQD